MCLTEGWNYFDRLWPLWEWAAAPARLWPRPNGSKYHFSYMHVLGVVQGWRAVSELHALQPCAYQVGI